MSKPYKGSKRQKVWQHNSYFGGVAMARANLYAISRSETTSIEAKVMAESIIKKLDVLYGLLRKRIDR